MILGLLAGGILRSERSPSERVRWLAAAGVIGLASGWLVGAHRRLPRREAHLDPQLHALERGICLLFLAAFYEVIDVRGRRRWAFPLVVVGVNSIAAYCMDHLFVKFIGQDLSTHFGTVLFYALWRFPRAVAPGCRDPRRALADPVSGCTVAGSS
jgi:predicted acyltransferase